MKRKTAAKLGNSSWNWNSDISLLYTCSLESWDLWSRFHCSKQAEQGTPKLKPKAVFVSHIASNAEIRVSESWTDEQD